MGKKSLAPVGKFSYGAGIMEQFIAEIESYAAACGRPPQWVLRRAFNAGWGQWDAWKSGKSSPTMAVADRVRAFMRDNPPAPSTPEKDVA